MMIKPDSDVVDEVIAVAVPVPTSLPVSGDHLILDFFHQYGTDDIVGLG